MQNVLIQSISFVHVHEDLLTLCMTEVELSELDACHSHADTCVCVCMQESVFSDVCITWVSSPPHRLFFLERMSDA